MCIRDSDYVKNKSYNDRDVDLESVRKTVNNKYAENLSRSSRDGTKSVAGQGTTTQAVDSDECYNCGKLGQRRKSCSQDPTAQIATTTLSYAQHEEDGWPRQVLLVPPVQHPQRLRVLQAERA